MLFPGFVTSFRDEENKIHLYFYPGIDNFNQYYYNTLDLSKTNVKYIEEKRDDGAIEFIFLQKNIVKITCCLITKYNTAEYKTLYV